MANDGINQPGLTSGSTYYLRVRNQTGQYLYTVTPAFEAYNAAHIASYVVSAAAANTAGGWFGTFPTNAATVAGIYDLELCLRVGGSGAVGDTVVAVATIDWDGANIIIPAKAGDAMTLTGGERTAVAGAVLNATASSYNTAGSIGAKINASGSGALSGSGVTLTFHDSNADPVANVIFTVFASGVAVGSAQASTGGVKTFALADGTYQVAAVVTNGIVFALTTLTVSGATALTITGTSPVIPAAPAANQVVVYLYTRSATGAILPSVPVKFKIVAAPDDEAGSAYNRRVLTITSAAITGLVSTPLPIGATVDYLANVGPAERFIVPASGPYQLPDVIGDLTA